MLKTRRGELNRQEEVTGNNDECRRGTWDKERLEIELGGVKEQEEVADKNDEPPVPPK